jgi:lipase chaperone LimK
VTGRRPLWVGSVAAALVAGALCWAGPVPAPAPAVGEPAPSSDAQAHRPRAAAQAVVPAAAPEGAGQAAAARAFAQWVAASSALRGTALDGDWGVDSAGRLQPSLALRRRFDHLLQLLGQAPLDAITAHLRGLAEQDLAAPQADAVLQVWQRYLGLLQAPVLTVARPDQPETLGPALAEHQQLRRQWLGPAWAQAFYGEEEAALQAWLARAGGPPDELPPWIDRSALDAQALQRLAQEEALQARWQQRLAQARAEMARLAAAPELSAPQRAQAQARWLAEQFSPAEQLRVRALLGLPAPP